MPNVENRIPGAMIERHPGAGAAVTLAFQPRRVLFFMVGVLAALAAAHLAFAVVLPFALGVERQFGGLRSLFHMGREANLPTYWSALILLAAGFLLLLIATDARRVGRRYVRHWFWLGVGFIYMSVDEAAQIHEGVVALIWLHFFERGDGILYYVWYVPFIPVLILILFAYLRFLRHLPPRYTKLFVAAAAIFLGGAVGMEMIEAQLMYSGPQKAVPISQLFEESMEIGGVTLFVFALLSYLAETDAAILLRAGAATDRMTRPASR